MMENLTLHDQPPPPGGPQGAPPMQPQALGRQQQPPPVPQQLPPQMFTTAAQLLDLTDSMFARPSQQLLLLLLLLHARAGIANTTCLEKLLICLRDGRKLTGILRSWDQFGTLCDGTRLGREGCSPSPSRESGSKVPLSRIC
jgi:U6 snRNA-associated Sm-like protein LSm1